MAHPTHTQGACQSSVERSARSPWTYRRTVSRVNARARGESPHRGARERLGAMLVRALERKPNVEGGSRFLGRAHLDRPTVRADDPLGEVEPEAEAVAGLCALL